MNPDSGATYQLGPEFIPKTFAPLLTSEDMFACAEEALGTRTLSNDEVKAVADPGPLVLVSEKVAQQVKLGGRELERRQRRRKAQRQARKRNRS